MNKFWIELISVFSIGLGVLLVSLLQVSASDYTSYQEITFEHVGAKLLSEYGDSDFDKYFGKLKGRKFWGWRTFTVMEDEELSFVDETLYIIINEGDTAIEETIKLTKDFNVKKQYSASGTIELKGNGTVEGFKLGLEETLDSKITTTVDSDMSETYSMKIYIDPGTKLTIAIKGEGKITNGVAKYYRFFKNVRKGGFEVFVITTEYYSIEKVKL